MSDRIAEKPPVLIRPLHRWFAFWEEVVPSLYRVVAVVVAAAITATLITSTTRAPLWFVGPSALVVWIGLAVLQEHDDRITLPVDEHFEARLRQRLDPVLAEAGFGFIESTGARRSTGGPDTFLYLHSNDDAFWIHRDPRQATIGFSTSTPPAFNGHRAEFSDAFRTRLQRVVDAESDAAVVAQAITLWVEDPSLHLPSPPGRKTRRLRKSGWLRYGSGQRRK